MEKYAKILLTCWITAFVSILLGANVFPPFFLLALISVIVAIVVFIIMLIKRIPVAKAVRATRNAEAEAKSSKIAELKRQHAEAKAAEAQKLAEILARNERRMREIAAQESATVSEDDPDADDECLQEFLDSVASLQEAVDSVNSSSNSVSHAPRKSGIGGFGAGLVILSALLGGGKNHRTSRCDGNCDSCPPHYGYRYGRWYYGHGHRYGCQRGGNGGACGRTSRD